MIVIFDTSAISKIYATNAMYKSLCDLAVAQKIEIHIPYVVKREIETQRLGEVENQFNKTLTELKKLNKFCGNHHKISDFLSNYEIVKDEIIRNRKLDNRLYFYDLKAIIHEIDADQAKNALEAYFCGDKPLTNPKDREDIPDSFICQSIYSICDKYSNQNKKIIVIANDKKVVNTFKDDNRFKVYQSLDDFFKNIEIEEILLEIYNEFNKEPMEFFIKSKSKEIEKKLSLFSNMGEHMLDKNIHNFPYSNDGTALVAESMDFSDFDIDFKNPLILGKNKIGFNFTAITFCTLDFYINKPDYYAIFEGWLEILDDVNDYIYLVRGDMFKVEIKGLCSVEVNFDEEENNSMNLAEYLDDKEFEMDCIIENIDTITFVSNILDVR